MDKKSIQKFYSRLKMQIKMKRKKEMIMFFNNAKKYLFKNIFKRE